MFHHLPKIELHLHLDCSLSYEVVHMLDQHISREEYEEEFKAPFNCNSLVEYIKRAGRAIDLMQTTEQLRLVTLDLFQQLKADHVIYAEIRFAPLQHLLQGLSPEAVVKAVNDAVDEGIKKYDIEAGIILCTLRHFSEAQSLQTVQLAQQFNNSHVVGFDIAADESLPIDQHVAAFQYAHAHGIPCTAHAGEARGAESVWETLRLLQPLRIGHGVRSSEDPSLLRHLTDHNIHLEVCPTSNIKTAVYDSIEKHPADSLLQNGVSISINTDGRTIADVNLNQEYELTNRIFGWKEAEWLKCNLEAIAHSFASTEVKEKISRMLITSYPTK